MRTFYTDAYEAVRREMTLPHATGCPELEATAILNAVRREPGLRKGPLADHVKVLLGRLRSTDDEKRTLLRCIDCMVYCGYLARYDFSYHLTPSGQRRLEELKALNKDVSVGLILGLY